MIFWPDFLPFTKIRVRGANDLFECLLFFCCSLIRQAQISQPIAINNIISKNSWREQNRILINHQSSVRHTNENEHAHDQKINRKYTDFHSFSFYKFIENNRRWSVLLQYYLCHCMRTGNPYQQIEKKRPHTERSVGRVFLTFRFQLILILDWMKSIQLNWWVWRTKNRSKEFLNCDTESLWPKHKKQTQTSFDRIDWIEIVCNCFALLFDCCFLFSIQ